MNRTAYLNDDEVADYMLSAGMPTDWLPGPLAHGAYKIEHWQDHCGITMPAITLVAPIRFDRSAPPKEPK